jgi:hypothetical protein
MMKRLPAEPPAGFFFVFLLIEANPFFHFHQGNVEKNKAGKDIFIDGGLQERKLI